VAAYLLGSEYPESKTKANIEFLCDSNKPANKIFKEFKEELFNKTVTITSLNEKAMEKIKRFQVKPDYKIKAEMDNRSPDLPLAMFFPASGRGKMESDGRLPANYRENCNTWEEVYDAWGYTDGEQLKSHRDDRVGQLLENIVQDLLKEGEDK